MGAVVVVAMVVGVGWLATELVAGWVEVGR